MGLGIIWGPIYYMIYWFKDRLPWASLRVFISDLDDFQRMFLDAQAFFVITVFISALFQLHNSPPVYERTFLLSLCPALAARLTLTSVSLDSYAHLKNRVVIYSYVYLTVWIILFFSHFRSVPVKLETIIRCCKDYYSVTPPGSIDLKVTLAWFGVLLVVYCLVLIASYLYAKHRRKGFSLTPFFI